MADDAVKARGGTFDGCLKAFGIAALILAAIGGGFWYLGQNMVRSFLSAPDPVSVATSSLQSLREQNRLSTFSADYVAVVTSTQSRLGLSARKTMIMPGSVRYEVDLSRLNPKDLSWDAGTKTLSVTLPPIEIAGPDVKLDQIKQYGEGGILMTLTDAEAQIDAANRKAGQEELLKKARSPTAMRLARDATRRTIARNFELPLRAAGVNATVDVRFADEPDPNDHTAWDMSRNPADVVANRY
jgi:hypothetical protein